MSNTSEQQKQGGILTELESIACIPSASGRCITCSDEALPARVLSVDNERRLALVDMAGATAEIDITLVDDIIPGDLLLVHGGVALALYL